MTSLVFRALDDHVIAGRADYPAISDERGILSYAQLLHESASLAGALRDVGLREGDGLAVRVEQRRERILGVLACARLGLEPDDAALHVLAGEPPVLRTPETEIPWRVLIRAGQVDPAVAPAADPDGYEERLRAGFDDVFATLIAGGTLT